MAHPKLDNYQPMASLSLKLKEENKMKNIFKKILLLFPLVIASGCNVQTAYAATSTRDVDVYLALTKNGLYNGQTGNPFAKLFLENAIKLTGAPGDPLPGKDEITSCVKDVEFSSWIAYDNEGKPKSYDSFPDEDDKILYAFFEYKGDGGQVDPPDPGEVVTIYFQDASWWNKDAAGTALYGWKGDNSPYEWPGVRMTHVEYVQTGGTSTAPIGYNYWKIDIDTTLYDSIIFTRVSSEDPMTDWGAKTVDISLSDRGSNNMYSIVDSEALWGDPGVQGTWTTYQA